MTNLKTVLLAATALTMMGGAAWAGDNRSYTNQSGSDNDVTVYQDQTSRSEVGSIGNGVLQDGTKNKLVIDQDGSWQKVGAADGDLLQSGRNNDAYVLQQGDHNNLRNVLQKSLTYGGNDLDVFQKGSNNLVASVSQSNDKSYTGNKATITQQANGSWNAVSSVNQTGGLNTLTLTQGGGDHNAINDVRQDSTASFAAANELTITQTGHYNVVDKVSQESTTGTGALGKYGTNSATLSFNGTGNGTGGLFEIKGFGFGGGDLGDGNDVKQVGGGNDIHASITGDSNLFGFTQRGLGNEMTVNVNRGDHNEIGIYQGDSYQTAKVSISGNWNEVGISQTGGKDNYANISVNSSGNAAAVTQVGYSNVANVYQ